MKLKHLLLLTCAMLISVSASAFELGKKGADIWHTKKSAAQAKVLQDYLTKVFGKKYSLKLYKSGKHLPGIFVGIQQPKADLKVDMERDFTVIHSEKDKVYIYGNDTGKHVQQVVRKRSVDGVNIVGNVADDITCLVGIKISHGKGGEVGKDLAAHRVGDALAQVYHQKG